MKSLPTPTSELPVFPFRADYENKILSLQDKLGFYWTETFLTVPDDALQSAAGQIQFRFSEYIEAFVKHGDDSPEATESLEALQELATRTLQQRRDRISPKCPPVPEVPALFPDLTPMDMNQ